MVRVRHNRGWSRRGFSLLWDVDMLAEITDPQDVVSIRQLFAMVDDWPEDLPAAGGDAIVVAGVEGCLDVLSRRDAEQWLADDLRSVILSFQGHYEAEPGWCFGCRPVETESACVEPTSIITSSIVIPGRKVSTSVVCFGPGRRLKSNAS
jgi:hypothetical protein